MFSEPHTPGSFPEISFSETKPSIFELESSGASEATIIQAKLNRRLGPEYVSQRPSPGGGPKLTYVEGWKIIGLANEVFGYNGWSSMVTKMETDFIDIDPETRRCCVGVTAVVKITLKDGSYHEDIGYGTGDNLKSKGAALDKAKKEAVTDGVKRALRNFGNLLGLCLYEKSFTQEIVKIKVQPPKFDKSDLHRRPDIEAANSTSSTGGAQAGPSTSMARAPSEDVKPRFSPAPPQSRSASTGSTSHHAIIQNARNFVKAQAQAQQGGPAAGSRTGLNTPVDTPAHKQAPLLHGKAPLFADQGQQAPQQGPSSERKVAFTAPAGQSGAAGAPLKVSDSDGDIYFNDDDNDLLANLDMDDSSMMGVDHSNTSVEAHGNDAQDSAASGSGSHGSGNTNAATTPAKPMSALRQAIEASAASLATAGAKRPAEAMQPQSRVPPVGMGLARQQQRFHASGGRREPLAPLPVDEGGDAKRMRR